MSVDRFDAVVVGASLAGCTAAILLARSGIKVALVERHAKSEAYKHLCTHFIQASALPVLERLGLDRRIEEAGGLRNPIEVHTKWGWVGSLLETQTGDEACHGFNIRRIRLDPLLRELAASTPGINFMAGASADGLLERDGRIEGVRLTGGNAVQARLVVAADGRNSRMARLAGIEPKEKPNHRFVLFVPMRNVDLKRGTVSQMWLYDRDVAYVFPNDGGVTIVAWIASKDQLDGCRDEPVEALKRRFRTLPEAPQLDGAEPVGDVLLVKDYPNLGRPPVVRSMALVGDAMASVDPLWGVGCGWAFQTGAWLADAVASELAAGAFPSAGLRAYRKACSRLSGHRFLICDFSRRHALNPVERLMFAAATRDPRMALHLNRFGARLIGPAKFLAPSMLLRALWVNARYPDTAPGDTRFPRARSPDPAQAEQVS